MRGEYDGLAVRLKDQEGDGLSVGLTLFLKGRRLILRRHIDRRRECKRCRGSRLQQARSASEGHLMICIYERPPHELFPWEYAMKRKPPPDPRHRSWMPEELFPQRCA